jgi:hypothetical protein
VNVNLSRFVQDRIAEAMGPSEEELAEAYRTGRERDMEVYEDWKGASVEANQYLGDAPSVTRDPDIRAMASAKEPTNIARAIYKYRRQLLRPMSDSESDSTENGENGETDEQNSSDSSEFVESIQSGLGDGLLESLGGDDDGGFESIGRELGAQVGHLLGETLGRQLDEQIQRMTEEEDTDTDEENGEDEEEEDESDEEGDSNGSSSTDPEEMSDEELQSTAEEISDELEERQ